MMQSKIWEHYNKTMKFKKSNNKEGIEIKDNLKIENKIPF